MKDYSYVEASVKRRETVGSKMLRVFMIVVAIFAVFLSLYNIPTFLISLAIIFAVIYFFPRLNVVYEYVFVDGQLDFDKIFGGVKRKSDLRIELEQVQIIAPLDSHTLDQYKEQSFRTKNYSSRDPNIKPYVIIYRKGDSAYKIIFEPSEDLKKAIKLKAPRKIVE